MPEAHLIAGDCTTTFESPDRTDETRGRVVCLRKADDTVLVHDTTGYQPVAWLTRPETAIVAGSPPTLEARDGDSRLRVLFHDVSLDTRLPASPAGTPVGPCPDCSGALVHHASTLSCTDCSREHGLPNGATVLDEACTCGLPRVVVVRGDRFEVCADRTCAPLDDKIQARFDCPDCGDDLRVVRAGGLWLGCDASPDCSVSFAVPDAELGEACDCGLPTVVAGDETRCLDTGCSSP